MNSPGHHGTTPGASPSDGVVVETPPSNPAGLDGDAPLTTLSAEGSQRVAGLLNAEYVGGQSHAPRPGKPASVGVVVDERSAAAPSTTPHHVWFEVASCSSCGRSYPDHLLHRVVGAGHVCAGCICDLTGPDAAA